MNNASYGWVAHTENDLKINELSHLGQVDYAAAAAALGAKAWRADTIDDFARRVRPGDTADGPAVVEVLSSPTASPTLRIRDVVRRQGPRDAIAEARPTRQSAYTG